MLRHSYNGYSTVSVLKQYRSPHWDVFVLNHYLQKGSEKLEERKDSHYAIQKCMTSIDKPLRTVIFPFSASSDNK